MTDSARGTARPLRIIHVTPTYAPCVGGAEQMLQEVSERLVARGHQVTVFTINGASQREVMDPRGGELPALETMNGVRVRRFAPEGWGTRAFRAFSNLPGGWRSAAAFFGYGVGMLRRRPAPLGMVPALLGADVDTVTTVNWVWAPAYAGHLARRLRTFHLLGVPILHTVRPWAQSPVFPPMLAGCDGVLVLTRAEEEFVIARGARNVSVVGVGIAPGDFARLDGRAVRIRLGIGESPVVGFIGRQDRLKGVITLIDAMQRVWVTTPDARLLLAGQAAHRSSEVNERLASLAPEERGRVVLMDDFRDAEIASVASACDIITLPSVEEGFGIVYLEGWMCGKPVIGARIASTQCVIDDGVDGLLAEPLDGPDLARCILTLLADPELRARMGAAGRAKTLANYTWDAVTDRWEAALQEAATAKSP